VPPTLLSGNESVAQGAWEAGAVVGVGYPGTPSTETLESFARLPDVYAEWAPNEKVALEVAAGVSMGGSRVLVTMKHVGVNVAADPLFTLAYTGVKGGVVILAADDPGMHSSQNEQDSRNWGPFARVPVLEPSDSGEARELTLRAFELSERFDVPVILRTSTRIAHSKGLVETGERAERPATPYESDPAKWLMLPANARLRREFLEERMSALRVFADETDINRVEMRDTTLGVVTSGVCYQYVREAIPEASVFKVALSFPLPAAALARFASSVRRLMVVEEGDHYLARSIRALGIDVEDVGLPKTGELSPGKIATAFGHEPGPTRAPVEGLPARPPLMCPGCPHRSVFYALRKMKAVVTGDIGCYTLGATPPLSAMDSCVCMGASIGMAHGVRLSGGDTGRRPVVGVIGDSTFAHSGITGLTHMAYNSGAGTILILDNRITAMTGHQGNPMMGQTLMGNETVEIDVEKLCEALGIEDVTVVDPHDLDRTEAVLREKTAEENLSVIVFRSPCALLLRTEEQPVAVDEDACTACGLCIRLGCPAIGTGEGGVAVIDVSLCVGCGDCVQVCRFDAIRPVGPVCDIGGV